MPYVEKPILARSLEEALRLLEDEFRDVAAQHSVHDFLEMTVLHVEPEKTFQGLVVYADGTDWDPGDGEGLYRHDGTSWVFVG